MYTLDNQWKDDTQGDGRTKNQMCINWTTSALTSQRSRHPEHQMMLVLLLLLFSKLLRQLYTEWENHQQGKGSENHKKQQQKEEDRQITCASDWHNQNTEKSKHWNVGVLGLISTRLWTKWLHCFKQTPDMYIHGVCQLVQTQEVQDCFILSLLES